MPEATAKIKAKGLANTGVTEELARRLFDNLGSHGMGVVEWRVDSRTEDEDGQRNVSLVLSQVEPAPNDDAAEHLRELARAFHYERKLAENGPELPLDGDNTEPTVAEVRAAGAKHEPHTYVAAPEDPAICDVCGHPSTTAVHVAAELNHVDNDTDDGPDTAA